MTTAAAKPPALETAASLDALLAMLLALPEDDETDLTSLPVFGGMPVPEGDVWSWDETRVITGSSRTQALGNARFAIISQDTLWETSYPGLEFRREAL